MAKEGVSITQVSSKKRIRLKGGSSKVHTSHKVGHKRGILSNCFTLQNCCLISFQVSSHKVHGKLITQGIDTNIKRDSTLLLMCNVHHKRLHSITD
ncbi:hypothetical protein H5410_046719 [Solanum commersonii]|uniref:Uncharacterized protein n=1 Tax=Solanum commersonii TaxID=4109 RepID=A0A9J5XF28_SOLCO|nr:hypothetical protein H5410_046719 [Solanum commersonii]